jgi:hypothetical protein
MEESGKERRRKTRKEEGLGTEDTTNGRKEGIRKNRNIHDNKILNK